MTPKVLSPLNVTQILAIVILVATMAGGRSVAQASNSPQGQAGSGPSKQVDGQGPGRPGGAGRGPSYFWWKDAQVVNELRLTTVQTSKIDQIYHRRQRAIKTAAQEYDRLMAELNQMIKERKVKPSDVEAQATKLTYPHFQIDVSRARMLYEMLLELTPEQHDKFVRLEQQRGRGRGPGAGGNPTPR